MIHFKFRIFIAFEFTDTTEKVEGSFKSKAQFEFIDRTRIHYKNFSAQVSKLKQSSTDDVEIADYDVTSTNNRNYVVTVNSEKSLTPFDVIVSLNSNTVIF